MNTKECQTSVAPAGGGQAACAWRIGAAVGLGLIFGAAGVSKAVSVVQFRITIDALVVQVLGGTGLPLVSVRDAVTVAVPTLEVVLGVLLITGARRPRAPAAVAAVFLVVLTSALVGILMMNNPPSCGCFGSWEPFRADARTGAMLGICRNIGLLAAAIWLAIGPGRVGVSPDMTARPGVHGRAGFTLIELLVVIAIVAALIAILLPALSMAKRAGKSADMLSAVRQSLAALAEYADAERGFLPYLATPGQPGLGVYPEGDWGEYGRPGYFAGQASLWPTPLLAHGIDLSTLPQFSRPEQGPSRVHTYMWLTHAAVARPEYWTGDDPPDNPALFAGVRLDEAVFPSSKGLLAWVGWSPSESESLTAWEVGMCDGSAALRSVFDPPMRVDGPYRRYGAIDWRVLSTWEGIRGRDY